MSETEIPAREAALLATINQMQARQHILDCQGMLNEQSELNSDKGLLALEVLRFVACNLDKTIADELKKSELIPVAIRTLLEAVKL